MELKDLKEYGIWLGITFGMLAIGVVAIDVCIHIKGPIDGLSTQATGWIAFIAFMLIFNSLWITGHSMGLDVKKE